MQPLRGMCNVAALNHAPCTYSLFAGALRKGREQDSNKERQKERRREGQAKDMHGLEWVKVGGICGVCPLPGSRVASGCPCHVPLVANFTALSLTMIFGRRRAPNAGGAWPYICPMDSVNASDSKRDSLAGCGEVLEGNTIL